MKKLFLILAPAALMAGCAQENYARRKIAKYEHWADSMKVVVEEKFGETERDGAYKTWSGTMNAAPQKTQKICADLICYIGLDVGMDYNVGGSSAPSSAAINLLQDFGYNAPSRQDYTYSPVLNSLNNDRPVYIHGSSNQILGMFPGDEGHAWLIDGYLKQKQVMSITYASYPKSQLPTSTRAGIPQTITHSFVSYRDFFHNNFGWNGNDNGYYVPGIFDASDGNGDGVADDLEFHSDTRGTEYNYQYNLRIWPNIYH